MRSRAIQEQGAVDLEPAAMLSAIVAVLALVASAGGLFISGLYRDNSFVTAAWSGNDLVTLIVAVPLLAGSARLAIDGSRRDCSSGSACSTTCCMPTRTTCSAPRSTASF
jgi:hypothetical protein